MKIFKTKLEERLESKGFEFLTDWTFFNPFPFNRLVRESAALKVYYEAQGYTRIEMVFIASGHINLWGKK